MYNAPPPSDATLIGSVQIGSGGVASFAERISGWFNDAARASRFLPAPSSPYPGPNWPVVGP